MGVVNATPDSFYPSSRAAAPEAAMAQAAPMVAEDVDVVDVGGESTRPGAEPVTQSEELGRVLPVLDALRARWPHLPLSIDTQKAAVARQAIQHGASLVNDVSGLRSDPRMAAMVAEAGVPVILMHMQGTPKTMQDSPRYTDVVDEIKAFFDERIQAARAAGIREDQILLDPGIGFGKTLEHNVTILRRLRELAGLGFPLGSHASCSPAI
jgi:dihydropteroate synthase